MPELLLFLSFFCRFFYFRYSERFAEGFGRYCFLCLIWFVFLFEYLFEIVRDYFCFCFVAGNEVVIFV